MSGDITQFLKQQKLLITQEKERLGLLGAPPENCGPDAKSKRKENCDNDVTSNNKCVQSLEENKENVHLNSNCVLVQKDNEDDCVKSAMLRFGEYSPNNPQLRVTAAPYLGLGEYEQRRNYFLQKQRADYLTHLAKLQYDLQGQRLEEKELSTSSLSEDHYARINRNLSSKFRVDQRLTSAQNALLKCDMEKPKSILSNRKSGSPRERLLSDLYSSSFTDGFVYRESRSDELERERLKREHYQRELRNQIEEKRMLQQLRDEQEMRERELENKRLEQQLLRMQEERLVEDQLREHRQEQMRRHSEDLLRRKQDLQSTRYGFRKHTNSECSIRNNPTDVSSKSLAHYSPPISRRNPYSLNVPSTSVFSDSSSRLQRRSSSGRFEDPLPVPVLKAHSPVAKELKNSIPYSSRQSSDAIRRLEDRWQVSDPRRSKKYPESYGFAARWPKPKYINSAWGDSNAASARTAADGRIFEETRYFTI